MSKEHQKPKGARFLWKCQPWSNFGKLLHTKVHKAASGKFTKHFRVTKFGSIIFELNWKFQHRAEIIDHELLQRPRDETTCDRFDKVVANFDADFYRSFIEYSTRTKNWTRSIVVEKMPESVEATSEDEMNSRMDLIIRGCTIYETYRKLVTTEKNSKFLTEKLRSLQNAVTYNSYKLNSTANFMPPTSSVEKSFRSMFFIDQKNIGPLCLPPKTGTTNWQR